MIAAKTTRKMTLAGDQYAAGDPIKVTKEQFADLGPDGIGWIEREPVAAKPAERKPATKRTASKAVKPAD